MDVNVFESKNTLFEICDSELLNNIFSSSVKILETLNKYDNNSKLINRKPDSLRSLTVILNLLTEILNRVWDHYRSYGIIDDDNNTSDDSSLELTAEKLGIVFPSSFTSGQTLYRSSKPRKIDPNVALKTLETVSTIKTFNIVKETLDEILNYGNYLKPNVEIENSDNIIYKRLISRIDESCDGIIKYIAASNQQEFLEFLKLKFKRINVDINYIPHCDFLSLIYLDSTNVLNYFKLIKDIVSISSRQSQQHLVFSFLSISVDNWILTRTKDYIFASKNSSISTATASLFETIYKTTDFKFFYKSAFGVLSSLLMLMPQETEKFLNEDHHNFLDFNTIQHPKKATKSLKRSLGNKSIKQKFIEDLVNILKVHSDAADSIFRLFINSCAISLYDKNSPFVEFSRSHFDPFYYDLSMEHLEYYPPNLGKQSLEHLRVQLFTTAFLLEPEATISRTLVNLKNKNLYATLEIVTGSLRFLTQITVMGEKYFEHIETLVLELLNYTKSISNDLLDGLSTKSNDTLSSDSIESKSMVSTSDDSMMDLMDVLQEHIPSQQTDPNIARNPLNNGNNSNNNTNNNNSKATTILGNSSSSSEVTSPSSIVSPSSRSRTFSVSRSKTGSIKPTGATTTIPSTPGSHFRRRSSNGKSTSQTPTESLADQLNSSLSVSTIDESSSSSHHDNNNIHQHLQQQNTQYSSSTSTPTLITSASASASVSTTSAAQPPPNLKVSVPQSRQPAITSASKSSFDSSITNPETNISPSLKTFYLNKAIPKSLFKNSSHGVSSSDNNSTSNNSNTSSGSVIGNNKNRNSNSNSNSNSSTSTNNHHHHHTNAASNSSTTAAGTSAVTSPVSGPVVDTSAAISINSISNSATSSPLTNNQGESRYRDEDKAAMSDASSIYSASELVLPSQTLAKTLATSQTTNYQSALHATAPLNIDIPFGYIRRRVDTVNQRESILKNLLAILSVHPYLILMYFVRSDKPDITFDFPKFEVEFNDIISPVLLLMASDDDEITGEISKFVLSFIITASNKEASKTAIAYLASAVIVDVLAKFSLSSDISLAKREKVLYLLSNFLDAREICVAYEDDLLSPDNPPYNLYHETKSCARLIKNLEKCMLLGLFSNRIDSYRISKRLVKHFLFILTSPFHKSDCFENINGDLYRSIVTEKMPAGFVAIKKKLRDHLTEVRDASPILLDVWNLMFDNFCVFHHIEENINTELKEKNLSATPSSAVSDAHDYGDYLASLGGIILSKSFQNDPKFPVYYKNLKFFLEYKIENLFNADPKVREKCRYVLCVSMHPSCCGLILSLLKDKLDILNDAIANGEYYIVDQFLSVLRAIVDVDPIALFPHATEVLNIMHRFLDLFNIDNSDTAFLKVKLRFCKLENSFFASADELSLGSFIRIKNIFSSINSDYLEYSFNSVSSRVSSTSIANKVITIGAPSKTIPVNDQRRNSEGEDIHMNIILETSSFLMMILDQLPLDTPGFTLVKTADELGTDFVFTNYFNLFVRILEELNIRKDAQTSNISLQHRCTTIIKNIIDALINLLKANSAVGLKYALPLGYHENTLLRSSFINVFAKIVQASNKLLDTDAGRMDIYSNGLTLCTKFEEIMIAMADSCPITESDGFANALTSFAFDKPTILSITLRLLKDEILSTSDSVEILRSNSVTTRIVALFVSNEGSNYLKSLLQPILSQLQLEPFEVEKLKPDDPNAERNLKIFEKYMTLLVETITNSISSFPSGLAEIAHTVFESTNVNFPEAKITAAGAFLFLRLYNPAIVSPDRVGIEFDSNNFLFKRSIMQLARIIQLMANNSLSSLKWPLMQNPESFKMLQSLQSKVSKFIIDVSKNKPDKVEFTGKPFESNFLQSAEFFHSFYYDHVVEIRENFMNPNYFKELPMNKRIKIFRIIDSALRNIGIPVRNIRFEIPQSIRNDKSERGLLLYDFMTQNSLSDNEAELSKSLIKESVTRDGIPLIIIQFRNRYPDCSAEALTFCVFQAISKYWNDEYAVLFDCTLFTDFDVLEKYTHYLTTLFSEEAFANCKRVYFYNTSHYFFQFLSDNLKRGTIWAHLVELGTKLLFISAMDDNKTYAKAGLTGYSNSITDDIRVSFNDVSLYQESVGRFIPVKLRIGNEYLHIAFSQQQRHKIAGKMTEIDLIDTYKISDLQNIGATTYTGVSNEITMYDSSSNNRIILASPKKIEIMRTLYFSRSRYAPVYETDVVDDDSGIERVLGQLLNVDFMGLLSSSSAIRGSSFKLLSSLTNSFSLDVGRKVESVQGMTFPYGNTQYILSVSTQLAQKHSKLTYEFLNGFFIAFENAKDEDKSTVIMYASPWIKNIYEEVYVKSVNGPSKTAELVRKFVRSTKISIHSTLTYSQFVWGQLALEDILSEMIIDEIVAAAIDHEAEGHGWDEITRYWPITPTVEVCRIIINKLRLKSLVSIHDNLSEIEDHTRWIELIVLTRFLSFLVFDSLLFVEMFLGDIFYIVSIYLDVGPLEFRKCVIKLIIRSFHAFLGKENLTAEQVKYIKSQIEALDGARYKMLFGLTRTDSESEEKVSVGGDMVSRAHSIESVCDLLMAFSQQCGPSRNSELWLINWNSNILRVAFREDALFQGHAIVILGNLGKRGVKVELATKFLQSSISLFKQFENDAASVKIRALSLTVCALHGLGNLIKGLHSGSEFISQMFWFGMTLAYVDNVVFYHYATAYITTTLNKMIENCEESDGNLLDYLFDKRKIFGSHIMEFDSFHGFKLQIESFDIVALTVCAKGIQVPFTASSSLECLKTLLKARYFYEVRRSKLTGEEISPSCYSYISILFMLVSSDEDLQKILEDCGFSKNEFISFSDKVNIPKELLTFLATESLEASSTIFLLSTYFSSCKLDETSILKFMCLFEWLYDNHSRLAWEAYPQIADILRKFTETSASLTLAQFSMKILVKLETDPTFAQNKNVQEAFFNKVNEKGLNGIKNWNFTNENPFDMAGQEKVPEKVMRLRSYYLRLFFERILSTYGEDEQA
ncbi:hypothetical protein BVG19_g4300 [[Candida] boidinii]|nr:hypothetical protein BVG19_g4300 [[Candida] boidinii]OWB51289.1 hypothetical protein B5S27_g2849 [[Candida] boidinii]